MAPVRFCTVCKKPIPLKRITRGSFYCSSDCRDKAKNEMRCFKAEKYCRLCGRPPLKPRRSKKTKTVSSQVDNDLLELQRFSEELRDSIRMKFRGSNPVYV